MRQWCGWLLVGLVVMVTFAGSGKAQEAGSDAPYLYYYSDVLNAFVIERADGADSRVFGEGLMPEDTNYFDGPGWSPSGKWFAWTGAEVGMGDVPHRPYAVSADGSRQLDEFVGIRDSVMAWSPVGDLLFVAGTGEISSTDQENNTASSDLYLKLIDASTETVIFSHQVQQRFVWYGGSPHSSFTWMDDGQHIIVHYINDLHFVEADPNSIDEPSYAYTDYFEVIDVQGNIETYTRDVMRLWGLLPSGLAVYSVSDEPTLIMENFLTGDKTTVDTSAIKDIRLIWNITGTYGLIFGADSACQTFPCGINVWLLETTHGMLRQVYEDVVYEDNYSSPDTNLPWSPDGNDALFITARGKLIHLQARTETIEEVSATRSFSYRNGGWYWLEGSRGAIFEESASDESMAQVLIYDFDQRSHSSNLTTSYDTVHNTVPRLSPDGQLSAYMQDGPIIFDTVEEVTHMIRPDRRSFFTASGGEVYWHSSGNWFLTRDEATIAGGGGYRYTGVVSRDGSVVRDLGSCYRSPLCIQWLPPQVDPSDFSMLAPLPPIPTPQVSLHGSNWTYYISWSPDGQQLLTDSFYETLIWDMNTSASTTMSPKLTYEQSIEWQADTSGSYTPIAISRPESSTWNERRILVQSPDGSQIVTYTQTEVAVHSIANNEILKDLGQFNEIVTANYSPDGDLLIVTDPYRNVRIWNTVTWEIVATLPTPSGFVAFSPDGTRLAVGSSWDIQIWDVAEVLEWGRESGQVD